MDLGKRDGADLDGGIGGTPSNSLSSSLPSQSSSRWVKTTEGGDDEDDWRTKKGGNARTRNAWQEHDGRNSSSGSNPVWADMRVDPAERVEMHGADMIEEERKKMKEMWRKEAEEKRGMGGGGVVAEEIGDDEIEMWKVDQEREDGRDHAAGVRDALAMREKEVREGMARLAVGGVGGPGGGVGQPVGNRERERQLEGQALLAMLGGGSKAPGANGVAGVPPGIPSGQMPSVGPGVQMPMNTQRPMNMQNVPPSMMIHPGMQMRPGMPPGVHNMPQGMPMPSNMQNSMPNTMQRPAMPLGMQNVPQGMRVPMPSGPGVQMQGMQMQSMPMQGMPMQGMPMQGMPPGFHPVQGQPMMGGGGGQMPMGGVPPQGIVRPGQQVNLSTLFGGSGGGATNR